MADDLAMLVDLVRSVADDPALSHVETKKTAGHQALQARREQDLVQMRADMRAARTLFDQPPYVAGSSTSHEAAQEIKPRAATLRERVFAFIEAHGPVSDEQIATGTGLNPSTARPRRVELVNHGRIVKVGKTRTAAGRQAWAYGIPGSF